MQLDVFFDKKQKRQFELQIPRIRAILGKEKAGDWGGTYGVGSNTFRAFRGYTKPPSVVYQGWAQQQLRKIDDQHLANRVGSRDDFLDWHRALVKSLDNHWKNQTTQGLSFAHSRKLVDLFIKWLTRYDFKISTDLLVLHANCALDRQTLTRLNVCLSGALPIKNPSMGDISSGNAYEFCQSAITEFVESCGGTRLLFDYYSWKPGG